MFNMFTHSLSTALIAFAFMAFFLSAIAYSSNDPRNIVAAYRDAHNDKDMDKAMSYLAEDFRLVFVKEGFVMNKAELRKNLGWDYQRKRKENLLLEE